LIIIDTDILSMFAKADALDLLLKFTGKAQIGMTPAIADEVLVPLQYGYDFPLQILAQIPIIPISASVGEASVQLQLETAKLGRGEREAIAFCQVEKVLFATNDAIARKFAQEQGVQVISLQAILRGLWVSGVSSLEEVRTLLERIKRTDYLDVPAAVESEIFRLDEEQCR